MPGPISITNNDRVHKPDDKESLPGAGDSRSGADRVFVSVVDMRGGREIGWTGPRLERFRDRIADVRAAVVSAGEALIAGVAELPCGDRWVPDEVTATFGVTLTAQSGVVLSRVAGEGSFEVSVTYRRRGHGPGAAGG